MASPECVVALKVIANRPRDLRDAAEIGEEWPELDVARINEPLEPFGETWSPDS